MSSSSSARPTQLRFRSATPEATVAFGRCLGELLFDGVVLALEGEMGSGKTTLVRGLALGLGIEDGVTSPTFALMQEHMGRLRLWHLDAWMADREEAFLEAGGADLLGDEGVAVIEWAEHVAPWLPRPRLRLCLRPVVEPVSETADSGSTDVGASAGASPPSARQLELSAVPADVPGHPLEGRLMELIHSFEGRTPTLEGIESLPQAGPTDPGKPETR